MKKILITLLVAYSSFTSLAAPAPTEKVLSNFNRSFPDAQDVRWTEEEQEFIVYFSRGDEKYRLWYDKEGVVNKSIHYYKKDLLSPFLRSRVENKFKDKTIYGITEVTSEAGVEYVIVLEDDKKWYHVKSDAAGNMSLETKFNKA